jgi:hypothetical protein
MADINNDGSVDFIYINENTHSVEARNINGAMIANFPIQPPEGAQFTGTPLITTDRSDNITLYVATQDSLSMTIRAYDTGGNTAEGFPLYIGSVSQKEGQPIHPIIHEKTLYAVSHHGELKAWQIYAIDNVLWGNRYGNAPKNKVSGYLDARGPQIPSNSSRILSKTETYNWPNPAGDFTNLRFQTNSAGIVDVKIITPSGDVIFNERYEANGNVPEEYRISTQNWSNGLYFAMITATVDGEKSRKMLKIVVVH